MRTQLKKIIEVNHGKVLAPEFDIFCEGDKIVVLVDGWDINELVEEELMEKIEH